MPRLLLIQPLFQNPELDRNQRVLYPLGLGYLAATTLVMNLKSRRTYAHAKV